MQVVKLKKSKLVVCVLSALTLLSGGSVLAAEQTKETSADKKKDQKLIVTGSRIKRTDVEGMQSIQVISSEEIEESGFTDLGDFLATISSTGSSLGETDNNSTTRSAQQVSLRNLGANKTLVLINGNRVPNFAGAFGSSSNTADVGSLPPSVAIERIEILTDAASAIYGSDAMAGVINVILKDDYDGSSLNLRYQDTERGGRSRKSVSYVTGFGGDGWSGLFTFKGQDKEALFTNQREEYLGLGPHGTGSYSNWGAYLRDFSRVFHDEQRNYPGGGDPQSCMTLLGENAVWMTQYWNGYPGKSSLSNTSYRCRYDRHSGRSIVPAEEKINSSLRLVKEFDNGDEFSFNVAYMDRKTEQFNEPRGAGIDVYRDPATGDLSLDSVSGWNRFEIRRRFVEFGPYKEEVDSDSLQTWMNYSGRLTDNLDYQVNFSYGENSRLRYGGAWMRSDALLDVLTLDPENTSSGMWYPLNVMPADVVERVKDYRTYTSSIEASQLSFEISGEAFDMPAGPVMFAAVLEGFTEDWKDSVSDNVINQEILGAGGGRASGERDHYAFGFETDIPLAESLNLFLAGRYDYYDDETDVDGAFSPSVRFVFQPTENQSFRIGWGKSFKAPDLARIHAEPSRLFTNIGYRFDPCTDAQKAIGDAGGSVACNPQADWSDSYTRVVSGNKALEEETGETTNIAWTGDFGDFDMSLELYRIQLNGEVNTVGTNYLLNRQDIYNATAAGVPGTECEAIGEVGFLTEIQTYVDPATGGTYTYPTLACVFSGPINAAEKLSDGANLRMNYVLKTNDFGRFKFGLETNFTHKLEYLENDDADTVRRDWVKDGYENRWKGAVKINWSKGDYSAFLRWRYIGTAAGMPELAPRDPVTGEITGERVETLDKWDAWHATNVGVTYRGIENSKITLGVNNLFAADPSWNTPFSGGGSYSFASRVKGYDREGRAFYLSYTTDF